MSSDAVTTNLLAEKVACWKSKNNICLAPLSAQEFDTVQLLKKLSHKEIKIKTPDKLSTNNIDIPYEDLDPSLKTLKIYQENLKLFKLNTINPLLDQIVELTKQSEQIRNDYAKVTSIINSLHAESESIKKEKETYQTKLQYIDRTVSLFDRIDSLYERFVTSESKLPLGFDTYLHVIHQLDEDILYLQAHPNFKDCPIYLAKAWNLVHKMISETQAKVIGVIDVAFTALEGGTQTVNSNLSNLSTNNLSNSQSVLAQPTGVQRPDDMLFRFYALFRSHISPSCTSLLKTLEKEYYDTANQMHANHYNLNKSDTFHNANNGYTSDKNPKDTQTESIKPITDLLTQHLFSQLSLKKEVTNLLHECRTYYLTRREKVLFPIIYNTLDDLNKNHTREHCNMVRKCCNFFANLYNDEASLYHYIFSRRKSPELMQYLSKIANVMYESLSTRILKIRHIETLAELSSVIRDEISLATAIGDEEKHSIESVENVSNLHGPKQQINFQQTNLDNGNINTNNLTNNHNIIMDHINGNNSNYALLACLDRLIGDIGERLVYVTHIYVDAEIRNYLPSSGDLAYPAKLNTIKKISDSVFNSQSESMMDNTKEGLKRIEQVPLDNSMEENDNIFISDSESITSTLTNDSAFSLQKSKNLKPRNYLSSRASSIITSYTGISSRSRYANSPYELFGFWYPTVRRTILCLTKLNRCLEKSVFQSISQDVLEACLDSLNKASITIKENSTAIDSHLFLIKHLLILREQISPFQTKFIHKEISVELPNVKEAAYKMLHEKMGLLSFGKNNAFLEFILNSSPQVHEKHIDSKKVVDDVLRNICQEFIRLGTRYMVGSLQDFLASKAKLMLDQNARSDLHNLNPTNELEKNVVLTINSHSKLSNNFQSQSNDVSTEALLPIAVDLAKNVASFYRTLKDTTKFLKKSLNLYLANPDTEYILFKPLKINAQTAFNDLRDFVDHYYKNDEDSAIINCPTQEQLTMLFAGQIDIT